MFMVTRKNGIVSLENPPKGLEKVFLSNKKVDEGLFGKEIGFRESMLFFLHSISLTGNMYSMVYIVCF